MRSSRRYNRHASPHSEGQNGPCQHQPPSASAQTLASARNGRPTATPAGAPIRKASAELEQSGASDGRLRLVAFTCLPVCRRGSVGITVLFEQRPEIERTPGLTAVPSATVRRLGTGEVPALLEQDPEIRCSGAVATDVGASVRRLGTPQVTALLKHHPEIERAVGIAAPIGATVGRLRSGELAALLEHHAEVASSGSMTTLVGATVRGRRSSQLSASLEQDPETERARSIAALIRPPIGVHDAPVRAPSQRHARLPAELTARAVTPLALTAENSPILPPFSRPLSEPSYAARSNRFFTTDASRSPFRVTRTSPVAPGECPRFTSTQVPGEDQGKPNARRREDAAGQASLSRREKRRAHGRFGETETRECRLATPCR
jgi:hypothetical protein